MLDDIHEFSDLVSQDDLERQRRESDARGALIESDEILDRLNSEFRDVPFRSGVTSNVAELIKALNVQQGEEEPRPHTGDARRQVLSVEPQVSRHFDPVLKMVAKLRAHSAFSKYKNVGAIKESWPNIVQRALEIVEQEVGQ